MSIKIISAIWRAILVTLILAVSPFLYSWSLDSYWSISLQMVPVRLGLGSTSIIQVQVVLLVLLLASVAGAITVSSLSVVARIKPLLSAMLAGLAVLLISEDYELSQVILGVPTGRDILALALVAVYALVGWATAAYVVRRMDLGMSNRK